MGGTNVRDGHKTSGGTPRWYKRRWCVGEAEEWFVPWVAFTRPLGYIARSTHLAQHIAQ